MKPIMERVEGFVPVTYKPVIRGGTSYHETEKVTRFVLRLCLRLYKRLDSANQIARLIRDYIDVTLRRYQNYSIKERIGAHYKEVGLKPGDEVDFEHVIPEKIIRDLLIQGRITIDEAMNSPTCLIKRSKHKKINETMAKSTPSLGNFWDRYKGIKIKIETHDGTVVDMSTWNLGTHYSYF